MATKKTKSSKTKPRKKAPAKKKAVKRPAPRTKAAVRKTKPIATRSKMRAPRFDPKKKKLGDILKKAIKGEEDGLHFYSLLAERAANPDAKRKLEGLRDDETRHKATLTAMYRKLVGGEIGKLPVRGINALRKVFAKGHLDTRKTEMEFILLAIEAELAATKYYREQKALMQDQEFVDIFDQLADEEHRHFELLQAEKDALSGNYNWFAYGDASPMED
ncbi:MAG: ferritin family protein [candidate division Zixibacteria bacterium]|nr:ferritin family protein [candidate division Zixibacteria bacterium]